MRTLTHTNTVFVYVTVAFITMSGLSYINFMPGVVTALAVELGYTDVQAGQVVAMNGYGGILGGAIAVFLVGRLPWRTVFMSAMAALVFFDAGTVKVVNYSTLLIWRFIAGVLGGICVGMGVSVLARLNKPDQAFGVLLFLQFGIGSIVMALLPSLEPVLGPYAVYYVMVFIATLSVVGLLALPPLSDEQLSETSSRSVFKIGHRGIVVLMSIGLYQTAAGAIWAYVGLMGINSGFGAAQIAQAIALTGALGFFGALLPVLIGKRRGRFVWVIGSVLLSFIAVVLFFVSSVWTLYVLAMCLLFLSWPAFQSYLLAVTAELDASGRLSTVASAVASLGLASGPLMGSFLVREGSYTAMLWVCAAMFLIGCLLLLKPIRVQDRVEWINDVSSIKGNANNA